MKSLKVFFSILLLCLTQSVHAIELSFSQQQILALIHPLFPYPVEFGDWKVSVNKPAIHFLPQRQQINLDVIMDVSAQGQQMQVEGTLKGKVLFDPKAQQLQFTQLRVDHLQTLSGNITGTEKQLASLRQNLGQELPLIVLLDFNRLGLGQLSPSQILIINNGITVSF